MKSYLDLKTFIVDFLTFVLNAINSTILLCVIIIYEPYSVYMSEDGVVLMKVILIVNACLFLIYWTLKVRELLLNLFLTEVEKEEHKKEMERLHRKK